MLQGDVQQARRLRRAMSLPEVLLWQELRKRPNGLKFRRGHPAAQYIADFYCHSARLIIEVDGEAHGRGNRPDRDGRRDSWFAARDIGVMRVTAQDVLRNLDGVVMGVIARASGGNPPSSRRRCSPPTKQAREDRG